MNSVPWDFFFNPRSMAIVGVSKREDDYVNHYVRTLVEYGFKGKLYLVNPKENEILGFKVYKRVVDIEDEVDLAFLAVPGEAMPSVLEDCGIKGVRAIIAFSSDSDILSASGSRGIGEAIRKAVKRWGFRVIGPNCLGIYRPSSGLCFAHGFPKEPGDVAFLSQSGGHAAAMGWLGASIGLRFSSIVSYGNAADIDLPDLLEYFKEDPETRVIVIYVEGVRDGQRLMRALREITSVKPVIVWKGGVTEEGSKAVATHTLAMAGSWRLWRAALTQCRALIVSSLEEAAYVALTFSLITEKRGYDKVAVVSISGGEAVSAADTCSALGLKLSKLSDETLSELKRIVPRYGSSINNPVDIQLAALDPNTYGEILRVLARDPNVDGLLVLQSMEWPALYRGVEGFYELVDTLCRVRKGEGKPIFTVMQPRLLHTEYVKARDQLLKTKIPVYPTLKLAALSITSLSKYYRPPTLK